uniref:Uncharacterized protein n=1 Tax=Arundo donax TaxID=35708 RepID=A0A0A8XNE3_ARUDO
MQNIKHFQLFLQFAFKHIFVFLCLSNTPLKLIELKVKLLN